jgi:hypothetical protein
MTMKKLSVLALALVWTVGIASAQSGNARVRVFHLSTDAPAVDVLVNDAVTLTSLPYGGFTDFLPLPTGTHKVSVNVAGTAKEVLRRVYTLEAGLDYTILAVGRLDNGTIQLLAMGDDQEDPAPGMSKVRVIHAASKAPAVDVYFTTPYVNLAGQTPILTGVPFLGHTTHLTVQAGLYQGRVAVAGTKNVAVDSGPIRLKSGEIRTLVALDPAAAGGQFQIAVLTDKN